MGDGTINRKYKDRLFSFLFGREENKEWTLALYNALNHSDYRNSKDLELTTIEDVVYMGMKNDVSFLFQNIMNLYEQQATFNPNMPVRALIYVGKLYDKHIKRHHLNIYSRRLVPLPVPKLVTFYNGAEDIEDQTLHLSDAFPTKANSSVSVDVRLININLGYNTDLLASCKPLYEYSWFVGEVRKNAKIMEIEKAVDNAIRDMPKDFAIYPFLIGNRSEVKMSCLTEYNEEETMAMFAQEYREEGIKIGEKRGVEIGSKNTRMDNALRMHDDGVPLQKIALYVNEDIASIEKWLAEPQSGDPRRNR